MADFVEACEMAGVLLRQVATRKGTLTIERNSIQRLAWIVMSQPEKLMEQLRAAQSRIDELSEKLTDARAELTTAGDEINKLRSQHTATSQERMRWEATYHDMRRESESLKQRYDALLREMPSNPLVPDAAPAKKKGARKR